MGAGKEKEVSVLFKIKVLAKLTFAQFVESTYYFFIIYQVLEMGIRTNPDCVIAQVVG